MTRQPLKKPHFASEDVINKRLYSIKEASFYLGRSIWAIREMVWAGKLPYVKDGRRILLDIHDMESWIEKNKTQFTY